MALNLPTKKPLTEEDVKWCKEILSKYEPLTDEEKKKLTYDGYYPSGKAAASKAKRMLETGYK